MKVLVRYILAGCNFCAPSGLRQGQVFDPQRRRVRDGTDLYECMMIHSTIKSPSVLVQGMHMKVLVRYIVTGCIFCAPSGLKQGQVFDPPAAPPPPVQIKVESPPPPPPGKSQMIG